jgi:DNA-binding NarL/FixJ family response regulator
MDVTQHRQTRVLVADDFPLLRDHFADALAQHSDLAVVATASDGAEAVEKARELRPDVLVLDLEMPGMSGVIVLAALAAELPSVRALVVTGHEEGRLLAGAMVNGAAGVLTKRASARELQDAVLAVGRGERVFCAALLTHLSRDFAVGAPAPPRLPWRELRMLVFVCEGRTDAEICSALGVSRRTVQNDLARIRQKTGAANRAEMARWATEHLVA